MSDYTNKEIIEQIFCIPHSYQSDNLVNQLIQYHKFEEILVELESLKKSKKEFIENVSSHLKYCDTIFQDEIEDLENSQNFVNNVSKFTRNMFNLWTNIEMSDIDNYRFCDEYFKFLSLYKEFPMSMLELNGLMKTINLKTQTKLFNLCTSFSWLLLKQSDKISVVTIEILDIINNQTDIEEFVSLIKIFLDFSNIKLYKCEQECDHINLSHTNFEYLQIQIYRWIERMINYDIQIKDITPFIKIIIFFNGCTKEVFFQADQNSKILSCFEKNVNSTIYLCLLRQLSEMLFMNFTHENYGELINITSRPIIEKKICDADIYEYYSSFFDYCTTWVETNIDNKILDSKVIKSVQKVIDVIQIDRPEQTSNIISFVITLIRNKKLKNFLNQQDATKFIQELITKNSPKTMEYCIDITTMNNLIRTICSYKPDIKFKELSVTIKEFENNIFETSAFKKMNSEVLKRHIKESHIELLKNQFLLTQKYTNLNIEWEECFRPTIEDINAKFRKKIQQSIQTQKQISEEHDNVCIICNKYQSNVALSCGHIKTCKECTIQQIEENTKFVCCFCKQQVQDLMCIWT